MSLKTTLLNEATEALQFATFTQQKLSDDEALQKQNERGWQSISWAVEPGTEAQKAEERFVIAASLFGYTINLGFNTNRSKEAYKVGREKLSLFINDLHDYAKDSGGKEEFLYSFDINDIEKFANHYDYLNETTAFLLDQNSRSFKNPINKLHLLIDDYRCWAYCFPLSSTDLFPIAAASLVYRTLDEARTLVDIEHLQRIGTEIMCIAYCVDISKAKKTINQDCAVRTSKLAMIASRVYQLLKKQNKAVNNGEIEQHTVARKAGSLLGEETYKLCFFPKGEVEQGFARNRANEILEKYYERVLVDLGYQSVDITAMPTFESLNTDVYTAVQDGWPHIVGNNVDYYLEYKMANAFIDGIFRSFDLSVRDCVNVATIVADFAMKEIALHEKEYAICSVVGPAIIISKIDLMNINIAREHYVGTATEKELFDVEIAYKAATPVISIDWESEF